LYEVVSLERRAEAIDSVGHRLMNGDELTEEMAARLRGLWERRLAAVRQPTEVEAGEQLRGFAWWFSASSVRHGRTSNSRRSSKPAGGSTPTISSPSG